MVKGISKQVIVVQSPEPNLFEQAIFILKEDALGDGISDEALLKEAKALLRNEAMYRPHWGKALVGALCGAATTGLIWLFTILL